MCATGGCAISALERTARDYRPVAPLAIARPASRVPPAGGGILHRYGARLRFGGTRYSGNPGMAPARPSTRSSGPTVLQPLDPDTDRARRKVIALLDLTSLSQA